MWCEVHVEVLKESRRKPLVREESGAYKHKKGHEKSVRA